MSIKIIIFGSLSTTLSCFTIILIIVKTILIKKIINSVNKISVDNYFINFFLSKKVDKFKYKLKKEIVKVKKIVAKILFFLLILTAITIFLFFKFYYRK